MKPILLSLLITLTISLTAQETTSSTGGNASGAGGTVSYTVGQVSYTSASGSGGTVVQGVQQAYEITVLSSVPEAKNIILQWIAYPNPASDYLKLSLVNEGYPEPDFKTLSYQLYDFRGKLLLNNLLEGLESTISLQNFSSGSYILKITENKENRASRELKTFKIIKK
jgi:hypothetical protein